MTLHYMFIFYDTRKSCDAKINYNIFLEWKALPLMLLCRFWERYCLVLGST